MLEEGKERFWSALIPAVDDSDEDDLVPVVLEVAEEVYETGEVSRLRPVVVEFGLSFETYSEFMGNIAEEGYEHIVTMPGLITSSNADEEDLNQVTWEIEPSRLQYIGADLWVESRVQNRPAVWISIIFAIGVLTIVVIAIVRRTRPV